MPHHDSDDAPDGGFLPIHHTIVIIIIIKKAQGVQDRI